MDLGWIFSFKAEFIAIQAGCLNLTLPALFSDFKLFQNVFHPHTSHNYLPFLCRLAAPPVIELLLLL